MIFISWLIDFHIIFAGNGYIAAAFDSPNGLFIRGYRALSVPVKFYPVVETRVEDIPKEGKG